MSRDLSPSELDAWETGEAARTPAAAGDEDREALSAMRMVFIVFVLATPLLMSGVIALVRHFLGS